MTEGPRAGGHRFVVVDSISSTTKFFALITFSPIPPGKEIDAHGYQTLIFRDTGAADAVFTRCQFAEVLIGQSSTTL